MVQDTFLRAWNSLKNFSHDRGTFQSFLYTIARNLVIDTQRKKKHLSLDGENVPEVESSENLFDKLTKSEDIRTAHKALLHLPEEERRLLVLRYFEDFSYSEIANIVGLEEGNVRVKVHRLLKTLRGFLEE
ncbi:RNA polymerase sigma factor [Candidatus Woesebacteria bacterium]|nr:RNA polymerase sigma factor [Candidatus Woesebacteria bacterium]